MPVVVVTSADGDPAVVVPVVVVLEVVMVHSAATVQFRIKHCVSRAQDGVTTLGIVFCASTASASTSHGYC